jgi:hypothetical protein
LFLADWETLRIIEVQRQTAVVPHLRADPRCSAMSRQQLQALRLGYPEASLTSSRLQLSSTDPNSRLPFPGDVIPSCAPNTTAVDESTVPRDRRMHGCEFGVDAELSVAGLAGRRGSSQC